MVCQLVPDKFCIEQYTYIDGCAIKAIPFVSACVIVTIGAKLFLY